MLVNTDALPSGYDAIVLPAAGVHADETTGVKDHDWPLCVLLPGFTTVNRSY